jgi:hypothetical protein
MNPQGLWSFKNDCKCSERLTIVTKNDRADLKVNNVNVKKNRLENSYLEMPLIHSAGYRFSYKLLHFLGPKNVRCISCVDENIKLTVPYLVGTMNLIN